MANSNSGKQNRHPPRYRHGDLLPSELRLRDFVAKQQLRTMKASLSIHAAADRGRKNKDWRANPGSADLAIIPDSEILNARARQLSRDSWLAKSIGKAFSRNIVGKGIQVVPHAKDVDGSPLAALNKKAKAGFDHWAKCKEVCDVEKKQTYAQKQQLSVTERATVGEHFLVWSYAPPLRSDGSIDRSEPVGLRLQSMEPEQLDLRILSFEGREVRGGIEIDDNGAAVAYHFYTRNPNDYLYRKAFWSKRVPRERVLHYYKQERVLQTRGVSPLTPVMSDMRDYAAYREAMLWRARMEACIGLIIRKPYPTPTGSPLSYPLSAGDTGATQSGARTVDMMPGMVGELLPGEDVTTMTPTTPGNMFEPFTENTIRGIGAGVGISYGQISRQSQGTYSVARQDMLEDRKEWEPEQELLVDDQIRPVYVLWFNFAALEGRFDGVDGFDVDEFVNERHRFTDAEYIPPPQTWIDPLKEANAFAVLLNNRLITREEIIALRGQRFISVVNKIAGEKDELDDLGLTVPEDARDRTELRDIVKGMITVGGSSNTKVTRNSDMPLLLAYVGVPTTKSPPAETDIDEAKSKADAYGVAVRAGAVSPQMDDEKEFRKQLDLKPMNNDVKEAWTTDNGVRRPITLTQPGGAHPMATPGTGGSPLIGKGGKSGQDQPVGPPVTEKNPSANLALPQIMKAPNYQPAVDAVVQSCQTCSRNVAGVCKPFRFEVNPEWVCDVWAAVPIAEGDAPGTKGFPPGPPAGEKPIDRRFMPDAEIQDVGTI